MININYPNAGRPIMEQIHSLHDWLLIYLIVISSGTLITIYMIISSARRDRSILEAQTVECIWTFSPAVLLMAIVLPSLRLLYLVEEDGHGRGTTVKAMGHQWYWQYDFPGLATFDSYITKRCYRLLDVDNRLMTTARQPLFILISAADVLHSWTIPTIGVKADAVPGRVNKLSLMPKRPGIYYGQCREICGRNHSFIPISMECVGFNYGFALKAWINKVKNGYSQSFPPGSLHNHQSRLLHPIWTQSTRLRTGSEGTK